MTLPCAKLAYKDWVRWFFLTNAQIPEKKKYKVYKDMWKCGPKEQNKTLETNPKEMQIYELPDPPEN